MLNLHSTSHLMYYLSKQFLHGLSDSFKSSFMHNDVHLVNYGPIQSKIDDKAGNALGAVTL